MKSKNKMVKGVCYGCLQDRPLTLEHIIPQCIGGCLSDYLLCENSNSLTGHSIDNFVEEQLRPICNIVGIKRETGSINPFKIKELDTSHEYYVSPKDVKRVKPIVKLNKEGGIISFTVLSSSKSEAQNIIAGIEKKHGPFDTPPVVEQFPNQLGETEFGMEVGGRNFLRSIAKTAYNFLAYNIKQESQRPEFNSIRSFIFRDEGKCLSMFNYVDTKFMIDRKRPVHSICIHFDSKRRNIIGFVQFFSTYRFSVLLAENNPFIIYMPDLKYCFDPKKGEEIPLAKVIISKDISSHQAVRPQQTKAAVMKGIFNGMKLCSNFNPAFIFKHFEIQSNT